MNNLHLELGQLSIIINVALRIVTAIIFLMFIIPLQIKEANVKNGLKKLRWELLISGFVIFFVNTVGLSIIIFRYFLGDTALKEITEIITFLNTFGFFIIAMVEYQVYHQRYTDEQKKLHEKFDKIENKLLQQQDKEKKI